MQFFRCKAQRFSVRGVCVHLFLSVLTTCTEHFIAPTSSPDLQHPNEQFSISLSKGKKEPLHASDGRTNRNRCDHKCRVLLQQREVVQRCQAGSSNRIFFFNENGLRSDFVQNGSYRLTSPLCRVRPPGWRSFARLDEEVALSQPDTLNAVFNPHS